MKRDGPRIRCKWLVIGYGNTLRSDDGAGIRVAEAVTAWDRPGIRTLAVHQLTPELADSLALAERAIFIDARLAEEGDVLAIAPIDPASSVSSGGHTFDPLALLALARWLHGHSPRAWLLTVPGVDFSIGERRSETSAAGVDHALEWIAEMLESA